jgi:hypothetical protein
MSSLHSIKSGGTIKPLVVLTGREDDVVELEVFRRDESGEESVIAVVMESVVDVSSEVLLETE